MINAHRTVRWRTRPGLASSRQQLRQLQQQQSSVISPQPPQDKKVIIEAQGWVRAKDGTIILTAQPFRGTPVDQIFSNLDCHSGRGSRESGVGNRNCLNLYFDCYNLLRLLSELELTTVTRIVLVEFDAIA
ncbi:hypothetical protein [Moorena sp. SIO4A5]|uniref:hypothetical protein n=1 Tax=Moorena sp. SIO4A5 TaxID=2607838 RepID=UPI0013C58020|nr:hypothetical protein [Moorena sp. SIO4A5]NEO25097.1 hypothetical protein [Moorena sp. SIO4A5]